MSDHDDASFDRRRFLLGGGLVATGALAAGCSHGHEDPYALEKPRVPGASKWARGEEKRIASACAQCPAGCGIEVRVVEGRAIHVAGNAASPVNRGGIGPRGLCGPQVLYDPDRITGPLRRAAGAGERASRALAPATWDEALTALGGELARLRAAGKADRVAILCGRERGLVREAWQRFARAYGTPHVFGSLAAGNGPLALASRLMQGVHEIPAYDWPRAQGVLSFGSGLLDACQTIAFARAQTELRHSSRGARARIVHVGPASGRTAQAADEWVPIRPGTHGAFALGLAHVLVKEKLHDERFVAEHVHGFDSWKDAQGRERRGFRSVLDEHTPESVARLCGTSAETIERIARVFAATRPCFAWSGSEELLAPGGVQAAMAIHALNALLGAIDRPGGLLVQREAPLAAWKDFELDELATASLARGPHPLARGLLDIGAPSADVLRTILAAPVVHGAPPFDVLLVDHANPLYARVRSNEWRAGLERVPLVVGFSPFLDETCALAADWVLPDDTYLERFEDAACAPSVGRAVFGLRQPVVERLHDTRASGDVLIALAKSIGGPLEKAFAWKEFKDAVKARVAGLHSAQRGSIVEEKGSGFLKRFYECATWSDDAYAHEQWSETLRTSTGRFELASSELCAALEARAKELGMEAGALLAAAGLPPDLDRACLPGHVEVAWSGAPSDYPLLLIPYRPSTYALGSGANLGWLRETFGRGMRTRHALGETEVEIHPATAAHLGIDEGVRVAVESAHGRIEGVASLTELVHTDVVRIAQGGGHTHLGRYARGRGANVMTLLAGSRVHPLVGLDSLCDTRVRVRRLA